MLKKLRSELDLYCQLSPAKAFEQLLEDYSLKVDSLRGTDMIIVREIGCGSFLIAHLEHPSCSSVIDSLSQLGTCDSEQFVMNLWSERNNRKELPTRSKAPIWIAKTREYNKCQTWNLSLNHAETSIARGYCSEV